MHENNFLFNIQMIVNSSRPITIEAQQKIVIILSRMMHEIIIWAFHKIVL